MRVITILAALILGIGAAFGQARSSQQINFGIGKISGESLQFSSRKVNDSTVLYFCNVRFRASSPNYYDKGYDGLKIFTSEGIISGRLLYDSKWYGSSSSEYGNSWSYSLTYEISAVDYEKLRTSTITRYRGSASHHTMKVGKKKASMLRSSLNSIKQ